MTGLRIGDGQAAIGDDWAAMGEMTGLQSEHGQLGRMEYHWPDTILIISRSAALGIQISVVCL